MQPAARNTLKSNVALAAMLILGNMFFFACVAGQGGPAAPTDWSRLSGQPGRIVLASD